MAREDQRRIVGEILEEIQREALIGNALEHYVKTCRGRLAVQRIDPFTGTEETLILKGDVTNPKTREDDYMVSLFTQFDAQWFRQNNRELIEQGYIVPHTPEISDALLVNIITDDEITEILSKPFMALKHRLAKFTSPIPVDRFLRKAKEMNRPVGTVDFITKRLAELQQEDHVVDSHITMEI